MSDNNQEFDSEFFHEAVADAKKIRETAIENAKDHLEEAFTPKLQSMLSQTIQQEMEGEEETDDDNGGEDEENIELDLSDLPDEEESEEDEEEDGEETDDNGEETDDNGEETDDNGEETDDNGDEADDEKEGEDEEDMEELSNQNQLDLDSVMEFLEAATMDDRHDNPDTSDDLSDDNEYMYDDDMLNTGEFEDGYESDNQEPIMDDVNKIAQELEEETNLQEELEDEMVNAFMDLLSEEEEEEDMEDYMGDYEEEEEEMNETVFEVDLDEYGVTDTSRDPMSSTMDVSEPYDTETEYDIDLEDFGVNVGNEPFDPEAPGGGSDERNRMDDLDDPLEEDTTYDLSALLEEDEHSTLNEADSLRRQNQELKEELSKHRQAIKILREQINETNLINSKLLYTNRLFKKFGLSDQDKMRVIESFDRAKNTREAKLIYTSLAENLNNKSSGQQVNESRKTNKKQKLVEALEGGRSSQKTGGSTTPSDDKKQILNENENMKSRLQKLANVNQ